GDLRCIQALRDEARRPPDESPNPRSGIRRDGSVTGSSIEIPAFSDMADAVPEDEAQFNAATDALIRERPEIAPEDLRVAAIHGMVQIRPDGHTLYYPVWSESPVRDLVEVRCEVRSELRPGALGYICGTGGGQ